MYKLLIHEFDIGTHVIFQNNIIKPESLSLNWYADHCVESDNLQKCQTLQDSEV